jgi:hypothetical protein
LVDMSKHGRRDVTRDATASQAAAHRDDWPGTLSPPRPRSVTRLDEKGQQLLKELQVAAAQIQDAERRVREGVGRLRGNGVSWSAIGWCVGTSGEAARQRFGRVTK